MKKNSRSVKSLRVSTKPFCSAENKSVRWHVIFMTMLLQRDKAFSIQISPNSIHISNRVNTVPSKTHCAFKVMSLQIVAENTYI